MDLYVGVGLRKGIKSKFHSKSMIISDHFQTLSFAMSTKKEMACRKGYVDDCQESKYVRWRSSCVSCSSWQSVVHTDSGQRTVLFIQFRFLIRHLTDRARVYVCSTHTYMLQCVYAVHLVIAVEVMGTE